MIQGQQLQYLIGLALTGVLILIFSQCTNFISYYASAEEEYPEAVTLPEHFRDNGYYTISNGKVFHHTTDSEDSWDEIWFPASKTGKVSDYLNHENVTIAATGVRGYPYEKADVHDSAYFDGKIANKAIEDLRKLKEDDNFNSSLQAPLFMAGPGVPKSKQVNHVVEFVDLFPTLVEMARLPSLGDQLEGSSMVPILNNDDAPWNNLAVSKYNNSISIKTDRFLYTEWSKSDSNIKARMLFDHQNDPAEKHNIAEIPGNQALVKELQQMLYNNWGKNFNKEQEVVE